jgi:hypothetical protein
MPLTAFDWTIATGVAATLLVGMELVKLVLRLARRPPATAAAGNMHQRSPSRV